GNAMIHRSEVAALRMPSQAPSRRRNHCGVGWNAFHWEDSEFYPDRAMDLASGPSQCRWLWIFVGAYGTHVPPAMPCQIAIAWRVAATSWTRRSWTPCDNPWSAPASEPGRRSLGGAALLSAPISDLRDTPRSRPQPSA